MASRLGAAFATGALGPLNYAGQCILSGKPDEGLRELSTESLEGGLARGIVQAATRVGVRRSEIESVLPMAAFRDNLGRIAGSHARATEMWRHYAGGLGGLLSGVTDLTVDGRAPDTALCLTRLAKKVARDKPFAQALQAFSDDIAAWQELLSKAIALLNDTTALERAYKMRRLRTVALGTSLGVVAAGVALVIMWFVRARAKVREAIDAPDPCAVLALSEGDLQRVSSALVAEASKRRQTCEEGRAAAAAEAEAAKKREEAKREAERAAQALAATCETFAAHLEANGLTPEDQTFAGAGAPLFARAAQGVLELGDYGPDDPKWPCPNAPAHRRIVAVFERAVIAKPWNVPKVKSPSRATRAALGARTAELPDRFKAILSNQAADASKKAILSGHADHIAEAMSLCDTAQAMGVAPQSCDAVKKLNAR